MSKRILGLLMLCAAMPALATDLPVAEEGEECGGIVGVQCADGLECEYYDGADYGECVDPDAGQGLFESCGLYGPFCEEGLECFIPRRSMGINPQGICLVDR